MTPRQFITSAEWRELLGPLVSEVPANSSVRTGGRVGLKVLVNEITQEKERRRQKQGRKNHGLQGVMKNDSW